MSLDICFKVEIEFFTGVVSCVQSYLSHLSPPLSVCTISFLQACLRFMVPCVQPADLHDLSHLPHYFYLYVRFQGTPLDRRSQRHDH